MEKSKYHFHEVIKINIFILQAKRVHQLSKSMIIFALTIRSIPFQTTLNWLGYRQGCRQRHWLKIHHLYFSLVSPIVSYSMINRIFVTIGIRFKQHFDTRYFTFCNLSPPRMFLPPDLLYEYRTWHGIIGPLYVTFSYLTRIFYRKVSGFATDCPCGVWYRGLTTCLLYVGPLFGNWLLNNSWAVGLT